MRRILPPTMVGFLLIILFTVSRIDRPIDPMPTWSGPIGWACVLVALVGLAIARRQFALAEAEIMTFNVPRNLVTGGLFAHSRNPMYLSMAVLVLGAALVTGHIAALLAPAAFGIVANFWYIPFEEAAAEQAFGERYQKYRATVRRWI